MSDKTAQVYLFGDFRLDVASLTLTHAGVEIDTLSRQLLLLLSTLAANAGRPVMSNEVRASEAAEALNRVLLRHGSRHFIALDADGALRVEGPVSRAAAKDEAPVLLVDRLAEVDRLALLLQSSRLVTITGLGGIGKTALADHVAGIQSGRFPDGVVSIDLAPFEDARYLGCGIASRFGLQIDPGAVSQSAAEALAGHLRDKRLLLVLHGCEHLLEEVGHLCERWLTAAPALRILLTSREPSRARGEVLLPLTGLGLPPAGLVPRIEQSGDFGAVELFVARATQEGGFTLDASNVSLVWQICRCLDGIPLALEIAAARIGSLGAGGLLAAMSEDLLAALANPRRTGRRHDTLQATLEWSHDLLTPSERRTLRLLSVFRGEFTLELALRVASDGPAEEPRVIDDLMALSSKSLLVTRLGHPQTTHRLLDSTRAFARDKLEQSMEGPLARRRHAQACCWLLSRIEDDWQHLLAGRWIERHAHWMDDVRAAISWVFDQPGEAELAARLVLAANPAAGRLSLVTEFVAYSRHALARLESESRLTPQLEFRLCMAIGELANHAFGPGEVMSSAYRRALSLADLDLDPKESCAPSLALWNEAHARSDHATMLLAARQLARAAAATDSAFDHLLAMRTMAYALHYDGQFEAAKRMAAQVLSQKLTNEPASYYLQTLVDREVAMRVILARTLWIRGEPLQAAAVAEECVQKSLQDRPAALCVATAIAACPIALWNGDHAAAHRLVDRLRAHAEAHSMHPWLTWANLFDDVLDFKQGRPRSQAWSGDAPTTMQADMLATLDPSLLLPVTLARARGGGLGWCAAEVLRAEGLRLHASGDADLSRRTLREAFDCALRQGALGWQLRVATSLVLHRSTRVDREDLDRLERTFEAFTEGFETHDLLAADAALRRAHPAD